MRTMFYAGRVIFILARLAFRFVSGRPLSGDRKTDATFWRPATRSLDPSHTALRWEMMRGASRAAWRMAGMYLLLLILVCLLLWPVSSVLRLPWILRPSSILLVNASSVLLVTASLLVRRHVVLWGCSMPIIVRTEEEKLRLRMHRIEGRRVWEQEKILPVSRAAAIILATSIPDRKAREMVSVPKDYREPGGAPVQILLPSSFTGADEGVKKRLTSSVGQRLGIRNVCATWQLEGSSPRVLFSSPPEPPALVRFSDVRRYLEASGEWDFFYGIVGSGEAFSVSVTGDTPHGAVSAGSGAGKSELLKGKVCQAGHKGWYTIIMDWKEESQQWAKGLPGIRYVTSIEAIHDMCIDIGEEIEWRKGHLLQEHPRVLILMEEWSITAPLLAEYWSALRSTADPEERRTMPLRSPALTAAMKLTFTGRSLGLFQELVAIRFSARVTNGNADLRESFQVIHMARWKSQTVKMLAPDVKPFPRKPKDPGRWVAVNGDQAVIYQAPLYTDDEAKEWHQSGIPIPASPWSERFEGSGTQPVDVGRTQRDQLRLDTAGHNQLTAVLDAEEVMFVDARKLSDMVDGLAPIGITWNILRNAARDDEKGDPAFPKPYGGSPNRGYTYDYSAVREWARKRHASQQSQRESAG